MANGTFYTRPGDLLRGWYPVHGVKAATDLPRRDTGGCQYVSVTVTVSA